ncbi:MAG: hypothetical protein LLF94_12220 [Chlamydiales bacterium]|nr:hypothetical protein [Chlamydiales bacterium]
MSRSCHLYAGCHSSSSQVSLEFVVELPLEPSFDIIFPFRHFINVLLTFIFLDIYLTRS